MPGLSESPTSDFPVGSLAVREEEQAIDRVLTSKHFTKAPLLSSFLDYVCRQVWSDQIARISEHDIGVKVFNRAVGFDPREDNIVRTYARLLRKRLQEYYETDGKDDPLCVEIPKGAYVPVFVPNYGKLSAPELSRLSSEATLTTASSAHPIRSPWGGLSARRLLLLFGYTALWICVTLLVVLRIQQIHLENKPSHELWKALFNSSVDTFVVPADSGYNILGGITRKQLSLPDYLRGSYLQLPLPGMDVQRSMDLYSQQYTSFDSLQIVAGLSRLPEIDARRFFLRSPRDLRMDDLKTGNVIFIGSIMTDPWVELVQKSLNFSIRYNPEMHNAWISNEKPNSGEAPFYRSHWNEPEHETFATISFLPNLGGDGHILVIQGLDAAGTQAAAETLFNGAAITFLKSKLSSNSGNIPSFELLLQTTSIQQNSTNTKIIASRLY